MRFKILARNEAIGMSELEHGDPPMLVVFGKMIPTECYFKYQSLFQDKDYENINKLGLCVVSDDGISLEPCEGIGIIDASKELGRQSIEIEILGLDESIYTRLFQNHIDEYESKY